MEVFKKALNISDEHKFGESFDVELQEQKKKQKIIERELQKNQEEKERKEREMKEEKERMVKELAELKQRVDGDGEDGQKS